MRISDWSSDVCSSDLVGSTDAPNAESDDLFAAMAELNAGDEAFAEAVAEGTPPTESEAPAAEAAVAEVASAEPAGGMAEGTRATAGPVPASDHAGAIQAENGRAPVRQRGVKTVVITVVARSTKKNTK